jgi:general secretion pathway protein G
MKTKHGGNKGFTLVEIMVVVIILGILAAAVIPRLTGRVLKAQIMTTKTDIDSNLSTALDLYEADNGMYPTTAQGLKALIEKPSGVNTWTTPYIKSNSLPKDPWGNEYVYECPGTKNTQWYDLISMGPDGKKDTEDDIVNMQKEGK